MRGHFWTVGPTLIGKLRAPGLPDGQKLVALAEDQAFGTVEVTGILNDVGADTLVLLLHGLGGNADSIYVRDACGHVIQAGFSCLRMSMRGADGSGEDIYHAGLTADLTAMLGHMALQKFSRILVVGYSLGGHLALKAASEGLDARVKAIAAVSAPIDLSPGASSLDEPRSFFYREYILQELRAMHQRASDRGRHQTTISSVKKTRRLRDFDELVVVPRFGFKDLEDYYETASVKDDLHRIKIPTLYVGSRIDPMVPLYLVEHWLEAQNHIETKWLDDGGHVYFPKNIDLGFAEKPGLIPQILGWFG